MASRFLILLAILLSPLPLRAEGEIPDLKSEPVSEQDEWLRDLSSKPDKGSLRIIGDDIQKFGEEVAGRIDRVVKKNSFEMMGDPWTIQGIPLIFPSSATGFNLGLRLLLNDVERTDPHKYEIETQVMGSDKGRYKHFLRVDIPHALDGKFRFTTRVSYDRDISFPYFGIGNNTGIDRKAFEENSSLYQNTRSGPSLSVQLLRYLSPQIRFGPVVGLRWANVSAPADSLLVKERPVGIEGGRTHNIGLAFIYEALDFEPYPNEGYSHELFVNFYNSMTGSNYDFLRATYTYRNYKELHRELTLATRVLIEDLSGNVPFYELGAVGGSNPTIGFGGDRFMRGYQSNRFIDQIRAALGVELRWDPVSFYFAKQHLTLGLVPFFDIGRVWNKMIPIKVDSLHASTGWGGRLIWNRRLIIRTDFAVTPEGTATYLELGSSF